MAIEGLMVKQSFNDLHIFQLGTPDVAEAVGVTLEAYKALGYGGDPETAEQSLTSAYESLTTLGYNGRLFVPPPREIVSGRLLLALRGKQISEYEPNTASRAWTSDTESKNQTPTQPLARLAVSSALAPNEGFSLIHFQGLDFDEDIRLEENHNDNVSTVTMLSEVARVTEAFKVDYPNFSIQTIDHRDVAMLALMDYIRGENPKAKNYVDQLSDDFVFGNGGSCMYFPSLGRFDSSIIAAYCDRGRFEYGEFDATTGHDGIGFAAGSVVVDEL